jgi:stage II sporulation protein E
LEPESGKMVMCLSDGMGSGSLACKESEMVIELVEKFLEAGFDVETAVRMMNSAMVMKGQEDLFSTVDISELDLYDGTCHFYKIGAAATFIRRNGIVECLISTSLPVGVSYKLDMEKSEKDLYNGDFLVMVSDGVLEYLHVPNPEETMQEIIESIETNNATILAKRILERVLLFTGGKAADDMTVLATAIWEK